MDVTFTRTGERRYSVGIELRDAPALIMHPAPGYDPVIPHDLVHLAVEIEHRIAHGVFGQVADGGDAGTFRRTDGTPDPKLRRRGERLAREHKDDLVRSEQLAYRTTIAWHRGQRDATPLAELSERWRALAVGESMTVPWPA